MTIAHHPTDPTLAAFAAGALDEGRALVVSTHLIACPDCRRAVRSFERLRGIALEDAVPVHLEEGALQRALQQDFIRRNGGGCARSTMTNRERGRLRYRRIRLANGAGSLPDCNGVPWQCRRRNARAFSCSKRRLASKFRIMHMPASNGPACCRERLAISLAATAPAISMKPTIRSSTGRWSKMAPSASALSPLQGQIRLKSWMGRLIQPFIRM